MIVSILGTLYYVTKQFPSFEYAPSVAVAAWALMLIYIFVRFGGVFWQHFPSILAVAIVARDSSSPWLIWKVTPAVLLLISVALEILIPPRRAQLPRLRGGHAVGTRDDVFGEFRWHYRVYYPAAPPFGETCFRISKIDFLIENRKTNFVRANRRSA
jgi:hypothetical protein